MEVVNVQSSPPANFNSVDFPLTVWGDFFVDCILPSPSNLEKSKEWVEARIEELVDQVKKIIVTGSGALSSSESINGGLLKMIDDLERLGVSYHFEKEVEEVLYRVHNGGDEKKNEDDPIVIFSSSGGGRGELEAIALRFRLLRQHGYNASSDVFHRFADVDNNLDENLIDVDDTWSLLSFYEAAHLRFPGELLLEQAIVFTRTQLTKKLEQLSMESSNGSLKKLIRNALRTPLLKKISRLEARHYITIFEEDDGSIYDRTPHHAIIFELAKLDFSVTQSIHREEIRQLSAWWKSLNVMENLKFTRDRIAECYFWMLGVYYEPQYSRARIIGSKMIALLTVGDDCYDNYATYQQLTLLTKVVDSWDLGVDDNLDELLKFFFVVLDKTTKEFEEELVAQGHSYRVEYLKEQLKIQCRAWLAESKWRDEDYVPTLSEYLEVSLVSAGYRSTSCASLIGMGQVATKEVFEWLAGVPKLLVSLSLICRLMDDIVSHKFEQQRKHVASAVECYMKEFLNNGEDILTSSMKEEEVAKEKLWEMVEEGWASMNREITEVPVHLSISTRLLNLARIMETMYKDVDAYTNPSYCLKEYIDLLLVQPITF